MTLSGLLNPRGSAAPKNLTARVSTSETGEIYSIKRVLPGSTISLRAGSWADFSITGGNKLSAAATIAAGVSRLALISEVVGEGNEQRRVDYLLTVTGQLLLAPLDIDPDEAAKGIQTTIDIVGATAGSTLTGDLPAGLTLNSSARTITGTPTVHGSGTISITETLWGASNSPRTSQIEFAITATTLGALTLSTNEVNAGDSTVISILGATDGSAISGTMPEGFTLDGAERSITANADATGAYSITLSETDARAANSPRLSTVQITVKAAETPAPTFTSPPSITGIARVDEVLEAQSGQHNGLHIGWQWRADGVALIGQDDDQLLLTASLLGTEIDVDQIIANTAGDTASALSDPVGPVVAAGGAALTVIANGAEQRYEVTNASSFPGATWSWEDEDGNAIDGQTGPTLAYADAPMGKYVRAVANGDPNTASAWVVAQMPFAVDIDETFDAPDGTSLHGYNGWECRVPFSGAIDAAAGQPFKIRNGSVFMEGKTAARYFTKALSAAGPKRVTIEGWRNTEGPVDQVRTWRSVHLYYDPATRADHIRLGINSFNLQLHKTVAGTGTSFTNQIGVVNDSTPSVTVEVANGRGRTLVAGVETAASVTADGWDMSDVPEFAGIALNLNGEHYQEGDTGSYRVMSRILVETLPEKVFSSSPPTYDGPSEAFPYGTMTLAGLCTSGITEFDWTVSDSNGVQVLDWSRGVAVDGDGQWSIEQAIPDALSGTEGYNLVIRPSGEAEFTSLLPLGEVPEYRPITILTANVVETLDDDVLRRYVRLTGTSEIEEIDSPQVAIFDVDDEPLATWHSIEGPASWATFDVEGPAITEAMEGTTVKVALRDADTPLVVATLPVAVPVYQTVGAYRAGINSPFSTDWSGDYRERNIIHRVQLRYPRNTSGWGYLGQNNPHGPTASGQYLGFPDNVGAQQIIIPIPDSLLPGDYSFACPPGMTVSAGGLKNAVVSQPFANGYGELTVTDALPGGWLTVNINGAMPPEGIGDQNLEFCTKAEFGGSLHENVATLPLSGLTEGRTVFLTSDRNIYRYSGSAWVKTPGKYLSQRYIDYHEACGWLSLRNMTPDGINCTLDVAMNRVTSEVNTGGQTSGPLSPAAWAEISYLNGGTDLWINMRHDVTPEYMENFATALAALANPNVFIYIEFSNEVFNFAPGFQQHHWFRYHGMRLGFHDGATPIPDLLDYQALRGSGNALTAPVLAGQKIYTGGDGGWYVLEAVTDRAIGDVVPAQAAVAADPNWNLIVNNSGTIVARDRMLSRKTAEMIDAFDAAFGKARIVPVLNVQSGSFHNNLRPLLEWEDLYLKMADPARLRGSLGTTPGYWGGALGRWHSNHVPGWGPTEKALLASTDPTEVAQGKTAFWTISYRTIDEKITSSVKFKHDMGAWLVSKGLSKDAIRSGHYELNWHVEFYGTTDNTWPSTFLSTFNELVHSPEMGEVTAYFARQVRYRLGGEHIWFDRVSRPTTTLPAMLSNSPLRRWGLSRSEEDVGPDNYWLTAILETME